MFRQETGVRECISFDLVAMGLTICSHTILFREARTLPLAITYNSFAPISVAQKDKKMNLRSRFCTKKGNYLQKAESLLTNYV